MSRLLDDDGEAAEQGRRHVVGVALHVGGQLEDRGRGRTAGRAACWRPGGRRRWPWSSSRARRTSARGCRSGCAGRPAQPCRPPRTGAGTRARPGWSRRAAALPRRALPTVTTIAVALEREAHLVPQVERQAQAVEARAEVGGGGRDPHPAGDAGGGWVHASPSRLTPRPRTRRCPVRRRCCRGGGATHDGPDDEDHERRDHGVVGDSAGTAGSSPSWRRAVPTQPSMSTQGMQPSSVYSVNFQNVILPKPAGSEMKVRTMGIMRPKNTTGAP